MHEDEKYNILHSVYEENIELLLNMTQINRSLQKSPLNNPIAFWLCWI